MADAARVAEVPESFDFSEVDVQRSFPPGLATGFYHGAVTKVERAPNPYNRGSKDFGLQLTFSPMDADGNVQKFNARKWYGIPTKDTDDQARIGADGKELKSDKKTYFDQARDLIRAVCGNEALPPFAKKKEGSDLYIDPTTGEEVSPSQRREMETKVHLATLAKLKEWYNDPSTLKDSVVYAQVKRNDKGFSNISYMRNDDGGKEVKYNDFTVNE